MTDREKYNIAYSIIQIKEFLKECKAEVDKMETKPSWAAEIFTIESGFVRLLIRNGILTDCIQKTNYGHSIDYTKATETLYESKEIDDLLSLDIDGNFGYNSIQEDIQEPLIDVVDSCEHQVKQLISYFIEELKPYGKSWVRWQNYFKKLSQTHAEAAQSPNGGKGDPKHTHSDKEPITLKAFMELHCDCKGYDIMSKPAAMYQHERKGNINLNDLIPHKNGKARIFSVNYLYDNWADYRKQMPSLPPLKD